jgi:hypothetical protein
MVNFFPVDRIEYFLTVPEKNKTPIIFFSETDESSGTLDREKLDKEMAALAALSGADIRIRTRMLGSDRTENGFKIRIIRDGRQEEISSRMIIRADGPDIIRIPDSDKVPVVSGRVFSSSLYPSQVCLGIHSNMGFKMDLQKGEGFRNLIIKGGMNNADHYRDAGWISRYEMSFCSIFPPVPLGEMELNVGSRCIGPEPFFLSGLSLSIETVRIAFNYAKAVINGAEFETARESYRKSIENLARPLEQNMELHTLMENMTTRQIEDLQSYIGNFEIHGFSPDHLLRNTGLTVEKIMEEFR